MNCLTSNGKLHPKPRPRPRPRLRRHHSMPLLLSRRRIKSDPNIVNNTSLSNIREEQPRDGKQDSSRKGKSKDDLSLVPNGHCPTCGTQLYRFGKAFWRLNRSKRHFAKPLTIPGKVENGRCLMCLDHQPHNNNFPDPPPLKRQINILYKTFKDAVSDSIHRQALKKQPKFVYVGDYSIYGQRHGEGTMTWDDGTKYVGSFFNGLRDGKGTLYLQDGSEYCGDWDLNEMHGHGTRRFVNQDVYVGQYSRGKRCGLGKMHFINDDLYVGTWENDKFHGRGKYFLYSRGLALEGNFDHGKKTGKFKIQHPNGSLDIFKFQQDRIVGHGVRWNANRDRTWMLTKSHASDDCWYLGQKAKQKRIPIAEAVSIGYECEDTGVSPEPFSTMVALATAVPRVNGRAII